MSYKHSEETKRKISESLKGKKLSIETRIKKSLALKGKTYIDLHGEEKAKERKIKLSESLKGKNNPMYGKKMTEISIKKISIFNKGKKVSEKTRKKISEKLKGIVPYNKFTLQQITKKYPFFSKIEEMRYNPLKPGKKEIQVHCKNHNCPNSKEQGGWFTPSSIQLYERIRAVEKPYGMIENNFYCCEDCKNKCPIYNLRADPFKKLDINYTLIEHQQFREHVLNRDKNKCQYCGEKAEHVHHERPQKLEPFYALDPDFAWSCCKKCHYEKGHKDECSTGKLAKVICK
ncbi:MAG: hypothetical protein K9L62_10730 [Vallitaleaceae bacterium]|nr:hypothetical protein [Vallitaleaceae bacterium]